MAILLPVVFGLLVYPIHVAGLTLCDTDGTLEVVESTASNVFTCTGANSLDVINWILQRSNGNIDLHTCTLASCNNPHKPQFEASRPADDRSTLTVNGSTTSYLQYIQGQTIGCKTNPGPGSPGSPQQTQCTVDIVAVPSVTCDAHYNTGTSSTWTATVNCSVSGAYSYLNRHTCNLIQTSPATNSLGSGNLTVTSTSGSGGKYKTGYCQVTVPFPDVIAVYGYKMAVTPGRKDVNASFGGQSSFEIKRPSTPPSHNCPQYVRESQDTSCTCTATDPGQPAGVVRWTSTMTNQLSLSFINKTENGTTYTCEMLWNGQRTQSVNYTLQITSTPTDPEPGFPVGVVVGVVVAVLVVSAIIVVVVLVIRRRRGKRQNPTPARPRRNRHREEQGAVNRNVTPQPEESVHENRAFQNDDSAGIDHEAETEGSRTVNAEGLVYVTVAFNEEQLKKTQDPPPEHETTAYAVIGCSKMDTQ